MTVEQDYVEYHRSISAALDAVKNQVRNLIGRDHFGTDGAHKESILRQSLRIRVPETTHVGQGFVCLPPGADRNSAGQTDVLLSEKAKPRLYSDGELVFVTPDAVQAVVEVKTDIKLGESKGKLDDVVGKLADQIELVRRHSGGRRCFAGLFSYGGSFSPEELLGALQNHARQESRRVIDFVTIGTDIFARFWPEPRRAGGTMNGPGWHQYYLKDLAQAYFISNLALSVSDAPPFGLQGIWYPVEGGKESRRTGQALLQGDEVVLG